MKVFIIVILFSFQIWAAEYFVACKSKSKRTSLYLLGDNQKIDQVVLSIAGRRIGIEKLNIKSFDTWKKNKVANISVLDERQNEIFMFSSMTSVLNESRFRGNLKVDLIPLGGKKKYQNIPLNCSLN